MNKKGIIEGLQALIVPLIGIAIVLVVGFLILAESKTQLASIQGTSADTGTSAAHPNGSAAWNATGEVQNALQDIPGWLPIIVITIIGALLIGLVANFRARQ